MHSYPSLTHEEFKDACQALELRSQDKLDGTDWLSVRWTGDELQIKQSRKPRANADAADATATGLVKSEAEGQMVEEDGDEMSRIPTQKDNMLINFSITLSPTYSVPVLWFTCPSTQIIGELYESLIPEDSREPLLSVGVMGGISAAYHPVSDLPAFFVHPCNTHEALLATSDGKCLTAEDYLFLWLGVIGSAVGLHIPSKLVATAT